MTYRKISIYFKYCEHDSLLNLVKMWQRVDILKTLCDVKRKFFFFEIKEEYKIFCVKIFIFF